MSDPNMFFEIEGVLLKIFFFEGILLFIIIIVIISVCVQISQTNITSIYPGLSSAHLYVGHGSNRAMCTRFRKRSSSLDTFDCPQITVKEEVDSDCWLLTSPSIYFI